MDNSRRVNVILIALVVLTGVLALFTIRSLTAKPTTTITQPSIENVYFPDKDSESTFRYYNGNSFVSYDNKSDTIKPLTSLRSLYDIRSAHWYKTGVVFNVNSISDTSDLAAPFDTFTSELARQGLIEGAQAYPPELIFWNLSFATNEITPLGPFIDNELRGIRADDGSFVFDYIDSYARISSDGVLQRSYTPLFGQEEMKLLYASSSYIYYLTESTGKVQLKRYTIANNSSDIIVDNLYRSGSHSVQEPVFMLNEAFAYLLEESGVSDGVGLSDVVRLDIHNKSAKSIIKNVQGFFNQPANDELVFIHLGKSVIEATNIPSSGKAITESLKNSTHLIVTSFTSNGDRLYSDATGKLYGITNTDHTAIKSNTNALETDYKSNNSVLTRNLFSGNDNSYTLTVATGSVKTELENVYTYIRSKQLNPYEFTVVTVRGANASN